MSVKAGEDEEPVGNPRPEGGEDYEPRQKRRYDHQARHKQPPAHETDDYAWRDFSEYDRLAHSTNTAADPHWQEMLASKRALEERMDQLQQRLERLVVQQTMRNSIAPNGTGDPHAASRAVQPSHFVSGEQRGQASLMSEDEQISHRRTGFHATKPPQMVA